MFRRGKQRFIILSIFPEISPMGNILNSLKIIRNKITRKLGILLIKQLLGILMKISGNMG
jgi:hypothetical protein